MRIGVDVDSVLADMSGGASAVWTSLCPKRPMSYKDWTTWDMWQDWGMTRKMFYYLLDTAWKGWGTMPLQDPDIPATMKALKKNHYVHIITSRSRQTHACVAQWLSHQKIGYDALTFISGHDKFAMPIDVLVDDNPIQVGQVPEGQHLYLRDHPWNRGLEGPRVTRVARLKQVEEMLRFRTEQSQRVATRRERALTAIMGAIEEGACITVPDLARRAASDGENVRSVEKWMQRNAETLAGETDSVYKTGNRGRPGYFLRQSEGGQ